MPAAHGRIASRRSVSRTLLALVGSLTRSASSLAAVAPTTSATGLVPAYPWGTTPTGVAAIAGYLSADDTIAGLFAATRDCRQLSCVSQLTTDGSDRDPAWSPTASSTTVSSGSVDGGQL